MTTPFQALSNLVSKKYKNMSKDKELFIIQDKDTLWDVYLNSFPDGTNPLFRSRGEFDCQCCKQFVRNIGATVTIENGKVTSVWDVEDAPYPFDIVSKACSDFVKSQNIEGIFRSKEPSYGRAFNSTLIDGKVVKFDHFHGDVVGRHKCSDVGAKKGERQQIRGVLKRGLEELTVDALNFFVDTVTQDQTSIYRGQEFLPSVKEFKNLKLAYDKLEDERSKDLFTWEHANNRAAGFKNTVIGTLIQDLSEDNGKSPEDCVKSFEAKVAPSNYKRPKPLITKTMIDQALKTIDKLNLRPSLERRHARMTDVSINDVLFVDRASRPLMRDSLKEGLLGQVTNKKKTESSVGQDISIDDFLANIVPTSETIDLLFKSKHVPNLVSITAPVNDSPERLFSWNNDFAWSYFGNVTDSDIKTRVKNAGGNVTAPFRVSLGWKNSDDLDIHCNFGGNHCYFGNKMDILDIDMNAFRVTPDPVENMCWEYPRNGQYVFSVNNYRNRTSADKGFELEVESLGNITRYSSSESPDNGDTFQCLNITIKDGAVVHVSHTEHVHPTESLSGEVWGVKQGDYRKVTAIMKSPNHWLGEKNGLEHVFFVLEDCKNDEPVRGMYNEYLRSDLHPHRKVFEVLASQMAAPFSDEQLSGVGFNTTTSNTVTVKVGGGKAGIYNVKF